MEQPVLLTNPIETMIVASDAAAGHNFGMSVSIDGNYAIVGAMKNNSAYIFKIDANDNWSELHKLTTSDGWNDFGYSVGISGNYAIVGAHNNDDHGSDSGSAYIYNVCLLYTSPSPRD